MSPTHDHEMTGAHVDPPGRHRHQCRICEVVWEHGDILDADCDRDHVTAHTCPKCLSSHTQTWTRYDGPRPPAYRDHHLRNLNQVSPRGAINSGE